MLIWLLFQLVSPKISQNGCSNRTKFVCGNLLGPREGFYYLDDKILKIVSKIKMQRFNILENLPI